MSDNSCLLLLPHSQGKLRFHHHVLPYKPAGCHLDYPEPLVVFGDLNTHHLWARGQQGVSEKGHQETRRQRGRLKAVAELKIM